MKLPRRVQNSDADEDDNGSDNRPHRTKTAMFSIFEVSNQTVLLFVKLTSA